MKRWITILTVVVIVAVVAAVAVYVYETTHSLAHIDVNRKAYPVKGIDVSRHNGVIDYSKAKADTVSFVIIKATEGDNLRDPNFIANYLAASGEGLKVGAYHFFRFDVPGRDQARHFIDALDGVTLDLPLMIDVEDSYNSEDVATREVQGELQAMIDEIKAAGYPVGLYSNRKGRSKYLDGIHGTDGLWICTFNGEPSEPWRLWQHSHLGHVAGVKGNVDLDTYNGTAADFDSWCQATRFTINR